MDTQAHALPKPFLDQTRQLLGADRMERFLGAFSEEPPVSIRLNPAKTAARGADAVPHSQPVPWCPYGYYLDRRPNFTFDPLLHAGCYYVQEAASMFIHHALRAALGTVPSGAAPQTPLRVLDLCAAPGGKSTCALGALPADTLLWSNEPVRQRASILSENMQKWGHPGSTVTNNYPRDYVRSGLLFDVILCDVPCSGEGMFRRDAQTIGEWSPQQVEKCWRLQRDIVGEAWQCLRPGGLLVYSTCTFNTLENEQNVLWMQQELGAGLLPVPTRPEWAITGSLLPGFEGPVYRFIPGLTRSEGLFVAVMRKGGQPADGDGRRQKAKGARPALNVLHAPHDAEPTPSVDLDYATALSYLRGEALLLPPDTPRGLVGVSFRGHVLGMAKNIGSRANNLYPKEWRIKSTHLPSAYEPVLAV